MKTTNIGIRNFPVELRKQAKMAALKEGMTLQEWFIEAVKEKLERSQGTK